MRLLIAGMLAAGAALAQNGQQGPRPEWPCVPGRAVDPAYIETSESSGGQLFLFQKNEAAHMGLVMNASFTHPATIARAIGTLNGVKEISFPVDSTVESLMVLASLQCRNAIRVSRPNGSEMTASNSEVAVELQAGKILRVDHPDAGQWQLRLTGSGLYVVSVLAKSAIGLHSVRVSSGAMEGSVSGEVTGVKVQLVDAAGGAVGEPMPVDLEDRRWRAEVKGTGRYRVMLTGVDSLARPFQRVWPNLLK